MRALHVRASDLSSMREPAQLSFVDDGRAHLEDLDFAIDDLRRRYGNTCVVRGAELADETLVGTDIKDENTVHPVGVLHR